MDAQKLLSIILRNTFSQSDLSRRLRLFREYLEQKLFSEKELSVDSFLRSQNISPIEKQLLHFWDGQISSQLTAYNVYDILNQLTDIIKTLPNITLYISGELKNEDKEKIGLWFRKNMSDKAMIDFQLDEEKIGGCAFVRNGIYHDYSLHHYLFKKKQEILTLISSYDNKAKKHT